MELAEGREAEADGDPEPPLTIDGCFRNLGQDKLELSEPLPLLLAAITRCVHASALSADASLPPAAGIDELRDLMWQIVNGYSRCTLISLGLTPKVELTQVTVGGARRVGVARLSAAVLEALLEWCVLCGTEAPECDDSMLPPSSCASVAIPEIPQQMKQIFVLLKALDNFLAEAVVKKSKKGASNVAVPECAFTIGPSAIERVLQLTAEGTLGTGASASHLLRFALRQCRKQAEQMGAESSLALRRGAEPSPQAKTTFVRLNPIRLNPTRTNPILV